MYKKGLGELFQVLCGRHLHLHVDGGRPRPEAARHHILPRVQEVLRERTEAPGRKDIVRGKLQFRVRHKMFNSIFQLHQRRDGPDPIRLVLLLRFRRCGLSGRRRGKQGCCSRLSKESSEKYSNFKHKKRRYGTGGVETPLPTGTRCSRRPGCRRTSRLASGGGSGRTRWWRRGGKGGRPRGEEGRDTFWKKSLRHSGGATRSGKYSVFFAQSWEMSRTRSILDFAHAG